MNTLVIGFSIYFIIYFIVAPIIQFLPWIEWWNKNKRLGNPRGEAFECLDMYALALNQNASYFVYLIYSFLQKEANRFDNQGQIDFIMSLLMTQSTAVLPSLGPLTPYEICYGIVPDSRSNLPAIGDEKGWRNVIAKWAGISDINSIPTGAWTGKSNSWVSHPDNFLFQNWGIPVDSNLVIGFVTGWSKYSGVVLYKTALPQLLYKASPSLPGGWMGMLKIMRETVKDEAKIERMIWSNITPPHWYVVAKNKKDKEKAKCDGTKIASGAVAAGIGGAMLGLQAGAAIGAATGGPFAPVTTLGGAAIGALIAFTITGIGALIGAFQGNCI